MPEQVNVIQHNIYIYIIYSIYIQCSANIRDGHYSLSTSHNDACSAPDLVIWVLMVDEAIGTKYSRHKAIYLQQPPKR